MRYIKHYMETIAGIDIYPIISLLIFFTFFVGLFVYVIFMKKNYTTYMSSRPLDDNLPEPSTVNSKS